MSQRSSRSTDSISAEAVNKELKENPLQTVETQRPSVPNAVSKAYGAPGRVKFPKKQILRPDGNMAIRMQELLDAPEDSSSEQDEQSSQQDGDSVTSDSSGARDRQHFMKRPKAVVRRGPVVRRNYRKATVEEQDELASRYQPQPNPRNPLSSRGHADSPFATVAKKVKEMWSDPEKKPLASFDSEDKIASEARIAQPQENLTRRLLDLKEKVAGIWKDATSSLFIRTLLFMVKVFTGVVILLLVLQSTSSVLPETTIVENLEVLGHKVTSPVHSILKEISSRSGHVPDIIKEIDLAQLKALKDSTSAQFKHIKSRLDSIEATYSHLVKKSNTPTSERKINLFASGSGLLVDPYLTSPTRAFRAAKTNLLTRSYARWRGWPESIQHGPISAFTPWEDMGDCWCTPDSGGRAQLVVGLLQPVFPQELILEHMPKKATLQAGSAPKSIELWAQIRDPKRHSAVVQASLRYGVDQDLAKGQEDAFKALDHTWVKIGQWMYDIHSTSHVQTFDIQVPLGELNTPVSRLAFRASNNWGPVNHVCIYRLKLHGLVTSSSPIQVDGLGY